MELNRKNAEKSVTHGKDGLSADPEPDGSGGLEQREGWRETMPRAGRVMGVLQWNLFDGLVTRSKVKEAVAQSSRMKSLEEQTREGVQLQVRQAYYTAAASLDRIAATAYVGAGSGRRPADHPETIRNGHDNASSMCWEPRTP